MEEVEETITLVVQPPDRNSKGYIKRMRAATRLQFLMTQMQAKLEKDPLSVNIEDMDRLIDESINLILPFVIEPTDRNQARAALEDASQEEWDSLFGSVKRGAENAPKEGNSGDS